jgi:cellulose synthase/poly-beta-1,6-N-acetylglucosamine synthase-like glycosyltransferase
MWVLWLALALLFGLLAVWPFVGYPLTLAWLARRRTRPVRASEAPEDWPRAVDLVFCAYNEAAGVARKIENCLAIDPAGCQLRIHVYSDGSTDGTDTVARAYADRIDLLVSPERTGKSVGMNRLLARCSGDVVVFTDANVALPPDCLRQLLPLFADPEVGCVIGHLVYINADDGPTAEVGSLYWRLEERIKALEARIASTMGADGSIFAIRRRLFRPVPADIIDDMFTSLSILCDGYRIARADDLIAFERSAGDRGDEVRRKIRIACRSFNCHRLLWPRLRRLPLLQLYMYTCHKLLRWFTFVWLMLACVFYVLFALASPAPALWLGLLLAALALFAIAWAARWRVAQQLVDVLLAFAATARGVLESLQGRRYQTWQPPASSR